MTTNTDSITIPIFGSIPFIRSRMNRAHPTPSTETYEQRRGREDRERDWERQYRMLQMFVGR